MPPGEVYGVGRDVPRLVALRHDRISPLVLPEAGHEIGKHGRAIDRKIILFLRKIGERARRAQHAIAKHLDRRRMKPRGAMSRQFLRDHDHVFV